MLVRIQHGRDVGSCADFQTIASSWRSPDRCICRSRRLWLLNRVPQRRTIVNFAPRTSFAQESEAVARNGTWLSAGLSQPSVHRACRDVTDEQPADCCCRAEQGSPAVAWSSVLATTTLCWSTPLVLAPRGQGWGSLLASVAGRPLRPKAPKIRALSATTTQEAESVLLIGQSASSRCARGVALTLTQIVAGEGPENPSQQGPGC